MNLYLHKCIYYFHYSRFRRPITFSTSRPSDPMSTLPTTPSPIVMSTYSSFTKKGQVDVESQPSFVSLKLDHEHALDDEDGQQSESNTDVDIVGKDEEHIDSDYDDKDEQIARGLNDIKEHIYSRDEDEIEQDVEQGIQELHQQLHEQYNNSASLINENDGNNFKPSANAFPRNDNIATFEQEHPVNTFEPTVAHTTGTPVSVTETSSVEVRLKQISQEIEKMSSINKSNGGRMGILNQHLSDTDDIGRQSFLSLTDLIRTLRPNDKQITPQIDSDYSNAMRVLGESSSVVNSNDSKKYKDMDLENRALI